MADLGAVGTLDGNLAGAIHEFGVGFGGTTFPAGVIAAGALMIGQQGPGYMRMIHLGFGGVRDPLLLMTWDALGAPGFFLDKVNARHDIPGRSDVIGNPPPAQVQRFWGQYMTLVPVTAGYHVIAIDCFIRDPGDNQADSHNAEKTPPFPRLTVKANPDIGLFTDLIVDAHSDSTAWQTLSIAFVATLPGVIKVIREKRFFGMDDVVYWDNLRMLA